MKKLLPLLIAIIVLGLTSCNEEADLQDENITNVINKIPKYEPKIIEI